MRGRAIPVLPDAILCAAVVYGNAGVAQFSLTVGIDTSPVGNCQE